MREFHPKPDAALSDFSLSAAQLVVARSYGFSSWTKLKQHLSAIEPFVWNPPDAPPDTASFTDAFIRFACLDYGQWRRSYPAHALRLLDEHPAISRENIYTAAAAGDVVALGDWIDRDRAAINRKGGTLGWEPLLYACYSRLPPRGPMHSTLEAARVLLANGADPNAGFLWGGTYTYTGLTGAFGEGEDNRNQIPHPERNRLAKLLLDAGADPNDGQTLYDRHFRDDDEHLNLLLQYGLGQDKGGPWFTRLGERAIRPAQLVVEELWAAAKNNFPERVKLLVEHGVDVNTPGLRNGRTALDEALWNGNTAIAEYLEAHGARRRLLDQKEQFAIACSAGRSAEARALLAHQPSLLEQLGKRDQMELLHRAVEANRPTVVRLLIELGLDIHGMIRSGGLGRTPLHAAAGGGNLELVELLLSLGADPNLRDLDFHAKPIGWAAYGDHRTIVDYLLPRGDIFDAVQFDAAERVGRLLEKAPALAHAVDEDGDPLTFYLHSDLKQLRRMVETLRDHGVDLNARRRNGDTRLDVAIRRRDEELVQLLREHGAKTRQEVV